MQKCYLCQRELTQNEIDHNFDVSFCESAICNNDFTAIMNFVDSLKKEALIYEDTDSKVISIKEKMKIVMNEQFGKNPIIKIKICPYCSLQNPNKPKCTTNNEKCEWKQANNFNDCSTFSNWIKNTTTNPTWSNKNVKKSN